MSFAGESEPLLQLRAASDAACVQHETTHVCSETASPFTLRIPRTPARTGRRPKRRATILGISNW